MFGDSDSRPTPLKAGPQLAILVDAIPFQPGDTVAGVICRQEHIVAPRGTISIRLVGKSGVLYTKRRSNGNNNTTRHYHSNIILFQESRTVFDGPIHVAQNALEPQTWPFSIQIPTHVSRVTGNLGIKRQDRSFLPLDPEAIAGTPLPATFEFHSGHSRDELDVWVEYYLEATLTEEHAEISRLAGQPKSPKIKHARLPLLVNPPPIPPLVDFRILRHTIQNRIVSTQRLVPGREGDKLTTREHLSKFFGTSSVPRFAFSVQLEFPTVLQFGNTIPLGIRAIPNPSRTSPNIANIDQTIRLLNFKLRIMAYVRSKIDYDDSGFTDGYEKERKAYLEMDLSQPGTKMEVIIPCSWTWCTSSGGAPSGKPSTAMPQIQDQGESSSQAVAILPKSKGEEAGFGVDEDEAVASSSQPPAYGAAQSSFLDLGATMKLRFRKDHIECLDKRQRFTDLVLGQNFTTFNISLEHRLKWEVTLEIAGEKETASAEHPVTLVPGWN